MRLATLILGLCAMVSVAGCGGGGETSDLGKVGGQVTLNGKPLEEATLEFVPEQGGRPSIGTTDADGNYTMLYRADSPGALIGPHLVRITSQRSQSGGEGGEPLVQAQPERVPQAYNDKTTLKVEVKQGSNTHDFTLEGDRKPGTSSGA
ncbi:MAG: carboxypeptidase regulatory-like domain-containing protein [Pirellulaceae bacterium]